MLHAKRAHPPGQQYEFTEDGRPLTRVLLRRGRIGARFTLHGAGYLVRAHRFSGVYELLDADGAVVATTDRVGRSWQLSCSGRTVGFRQTAPASREYAMVGDDGATAGTIRRAGHVRTEVTAELPSLELLLQVFVLVVVLHRARRKRAAAGVRASAFAGG
ncbi:hypothetical protein [Actinocatenispora thailandica]|nr:hypothetical protein [Actinocatenispora thailandica]